MPPIGNAESVTDEDGYSPEETDRAIILTDYLLTATCPKDKTPYTKPARTGDSGSEVQPGLVHALINCRMVRKIFPGT